MGGVGSGTAREERWEREEVASCCGSLRDKVVDLRN